VLGKGKACSSGGQETTTELHLNAEKHTETVLHLNLRQFMVFFLFSFLWFGLVFSPL
jgi:hypothetical protein